MIRKNSTVGESLVKWFHYFGQDQARVPWVERFRSSFGAFLGLLCTVLFGQFVGGFVGVDEWFMASLGASSLLIFVLPSSPMAQPWAVIGGNVLSALVGITCSHFFANPAIALPVAASTAILGMFLLRCLHPPAAAVALIAVMGHVTSYRYAIFPVMIDSIVLCIFATLYNSFTGKSYPTKPSFEVTPIAKSEVDKNAELNARLNAILDEYHEVLDVNHAELVKIIKLASKPKEK
jgi:CBS domain-containing membrane protein